MSYALKHYAPFVALLWDPWQEESTNLRAGTRANYGASPGDAGICQPYLYVGPWDASRRSEKLGTHPFGAAITYEELRDSHDAKGVGREFFLEGAALLLGQP